MYSINHSKNLKLAALLYNVAICNTRLWVHCIFSAPFQQFSKLWEARISLVLSDSTLHSGPKTREGVCFDTLCQTHAGGPSGRRGKGGGQDGEGGESRCGLHHQATNSPAQDRKLHPLGDRHADLRALLLRRCVHHVCVG